MNAHAVPPPPNDNFASATTVTSVPFNDNLDLTAATTEAGEPGPGPGCGGLPPGTAWYAFTPATAASYLASLSNAGFAPVFGVYTGASLATLSEVTCHVGSPLVFHADAGTTYFIQVGAAGGQVGPADFSLALAPSPLANFTYFPGDPSPFDTIQFVDQSNDPAGASFQSWTWSFGDGTTATGNFPTHRYAADGDYTVNETVTTPDGRTASTSQVVHVSTHDVAIAKFTVPNTARTGQTKSITVGVSNSRYPETVQVQLFSSMPGGFSLVGTLTQSVPVQKPNGTVPFGFNYTFTSDDAAIGKVTFQAVAIIIDARDALPADNTATSLPTTVTR